MKSDKQLVGIIHDIQRIRFQRMLDEGVQVTINVDQLGSDGVHVSIVPHADGTWSFA